MAATTTTLKRIGDVFYETRVMAGRQFTVRRYAAEVLGDAVDAVMLSYIEKGKRFPSEALVRRLAAASGQDAHDVLAILWRDRMLYGFAKELRRLLTAPRALDGVEDAELAVRISQAIAALPDDESWITRREWRAEFVGASRRAARTNPKPADVGDLVEQTLRERGLIEVRGQKVRRKGRHFVAEGVEERQALAIEFCTLFAKGLVDKLALADQDTGTYLRNHYLNIETKRLAEFQKRLDAALRGLAQEFAGDASDDTKFLNVLVTSTPL